MSDIVISVNNISKKYKLYPSAKERFKEVFHPFSKKYHNEFWALKNVSLSVRRNETVGIIGQNGSGKSTLLQIICGFLKPTEGSISIAGRVSALLELGAGFDLEFSGRDNVYMNGAIMGFSKDEMDKRFPHIEAFAEIGEFIDQPVKTYSSGMFVRLAFASAINVDPDILIVDEALSVGDVYFQQKCFKKLKQFKEKGVTILFVSHDPGAVKNLCQRAILLDEGKVVDEGKPDEVFDYYNALIATKVQRDVRIVKKSAYKDKIIEEDISYSHKSDNNEENIDNQKCKCVKSEQEKTESISYRSGNKRVEILDAFILVNSVKSDIIETGKKVDICIQALAHDNIENITCGILIRDRLGNDVFGTNTYHLKKIFSAHKGEKIEVIFSGNLNIGPGEYTLTVASHTNEVHIFECFDWIDNYYIFRVVPDPDYIFCGVAKLFMQSKVSFV